MPESGPRRRAAWCTRGVSFDHLVGEREQLVWNLEAERLGSPEIDDQFELGGLYDRQVGRFLALEYPAGIDAGLMVGFGDAGSIAD